MRWRIGSYTGRLGPSYPLRSPSTAFARPCLICTRVSRSVLRKHGASFAARLRMFITTPPKWTPTTSNSHARTSGTLPTKGLGSLGSMEAIVQKPRLCGARHKPRFCTIASTLSTWYALPLHGVLDADAPDLH